ncbi:MAG: FecR family protein, partial [Candidatus Mariimomonas ferrooxydans]
MIKGDKREGVFSLSSGKLYTKVKKLLAPDSKFEIHTPTAVAAVRGTEWISVVESNPGSSTLPQPSLTPPAPHYLNHHSPQKLHTTST